MSRLRRLISSFLFDDDPIRDLRSVDFLKTAMDVVDGQFRDHPESKMKGILVEQAHEALDDFVRCHILPRLAA